MYTFLLALAFLVPVPAMATGWTPPKEVKLERVAPWGGTVTILIETHLAEKLHIYGARLYTPLGPEFRGTTFGIMLQGTRQDIPAYQHLQVTVIPTMSYLASEEKSKPVCLFRFPGTPGIGITLLEPPNIVEISPGKTPQNQITVDEYQRRAFQLLQSAYR